MQSCNQCNKQVKSKAVPFFIFSFHANVHKYKNKRLVFYVLFVSSGNRYFWGFSAILQQATGTIRTKLVR